MIAMICLYLCRLGQELALTETVMEREKRLQIDTSPDQKWPLFGENYGHKNIYA